MQKWTGGYNRSALHRVLNLGDYHRYSARLFYYGNVDLVNKPFDGGKEMTVEESIRGRLKESIVAIGQGEKERG
jgi:isopenicillin N synthase-like dioxygenase